MRAGFDKWWLLPFGILATSALVALGIVVLESSFAGRSSTEVAQRATSEPTETSSEMATADCSDAPATDRSCYQQERHQEAASEPAETSEVATVDCSGAQAANYVCYQQRYRDLVRDFGVGAAFAELRDELTKDGFVKSNCHQMTHVIGRAAGEIYGDIPNTYNHGDTLCGSGYYHGAMEAIVVKVGSDKILDEADTLCADLGGHQRQSFFHYNCAHGLGHGFMSIHENELFESLQTCDTLADGWERKRCYGGVFMENVIASNNPNHPSKYLKADQPLYPCDIVETRYKTQCYRRQTSYALKTQGNDFAKVFDLCAKVEGDFRPACYQGLGWDASVQSIINRGTSGAPINGSTRNLCTLGKGYEAQSNCVIGAAEYFIRDSYSDAQAKGFCESLGADLRAMCLQEAEEYYQTLQPPSERRGTSL